MAQTSRSARLDTKTKRLALERAKYHTATLGDGCYVIYRHPKDDQAGTFSARWRVPDSTSFLNSKIGEADDTRAADGVTVFSWDQAKKKAEDWFGRCAREQNLKADGEPLPSGDWKVRDVISYYISEARATRKDPLTADDSEASANANILPILGETYVAKLTTTRLKKWHRDLAARGKRRTGRKRLPGEEIEYLDLPDPKKEPDAHKKAIRARKSSANRELATLKAALNLAVDDGMIPANPRPWDRVKPFPGVKGQRVRFLTVDEQQALVAACTPEFRKLVQGGLYTGARYGELTEAKVGDFNPEVGSLWVNGKGVDSRPRYIFLTEEGEEFFKELVAGRKNSDTLFPRHLVARKVDAPRLVTFRGAQIRLSRSELDVLAMLMGGAGRWVTYSEIEAELWPTAGNARKRVSNTLDQLRRKLLAVGVSPIARQLEAARLTCPASEIAISEIGNGSDTAKPKFKWIKGDAKAPMKAAYTKAKIEKLTFHELRHTYASGLLNGGILPMVVAKQLGHADTRMVQEHYGHLCEKANRMAIRSQSPVLGIRGLQSQE